MLPYSYADPRELAPDVDEIDNDGALVDCYGRDVDTFEDEHIAYSLDEYLIGLFADVDRQHAGRDERSAPRAYVRANVEREQRARDAQRERFDACVSRYLARFVSTGRIAHYAE